MPNACHGCALKCGAAANREPENHLTAILAAIGGIPFYCHDRMGWTPDKETYPDGQDIVSRAIHSLMSAPKLIHDCPGAAVSDATPNGLPTSAFDVYRRIVGRDPVCQGWKAAVGDLARQGWFRLPGQTDIKDVAKRGIVAVNSLKIQKGKGQRKKLLKDIGEAVTSLKDVLKENDIRTAVFAHENTIKEAK